jgi:hypothetical protein
VVIDKTILYESIKLIDIIIYSIDLCRSIQIISCFVSTINASLLVINTSCIFLKTHTLTFDNVCKLFAPFEALGRAVGDAATLDNLVGFLCLPLHARFYMLEAN